MLKWVCISRPRIQNGVGWGYAITWQNLPVTEGNTYHASAWIRDGNADGASSLIKDGTEITWEWFADTDTRLDVNGDGETNNDDKVFHSFDLTGEWTQISATEVVPPGATMTRVLFGTGQMRVNVDVDDTSVTEAGEPAPPSNYVTSTDFARQERPPRRRCGWLSRRAIPLLPGGSKAGWISIRWKSRLEMCLW